MKDRKKGPYKYLQKSRCAATYAAGTLENTFKKSLCCYVCWGTLKNAFKKFAVLLRMLGGPLKMPSTNSLCCYVCCGDP